MSKRPTRPTNRNTDRTAAVTLEVPSGVADDIEAILRGYAEEAELDTSLVVDHSGFLIAGISSLPDVDVDTIGALVAGASGATEGLTGALGEEGCVESLHLGENRLLYLKEVGERYILVGVSDSNIPVGILRDQANLIEPTLNKHLEKVKAVPMSLTKKMAEPKDSEPEVKPDPPKSLRKPDSGPDNEPATRPKARAIAAVTTAPVAVASGKIGIPTANQDEAVEGGAKPQKDVIPESVFDAADAEKSAPASPQPPEEKKNPNPIAAKRVEPHAVVENSPFEMDEDEGDTNFKPVRSNTTPVHLSVPAARQREAAARKENEDDEDQQSGPRYSFELG